MYVDICFKKSRQLSAATPAGAETGQSQQAQRSSSRLGDGFSYQVHGTGSIFPFFGSADKSIFASFKIVNASNKVFACVAFQTRYGYCFFFCCIEIPNAIIAIGIQESTSNNGPFSLQVG